MKGKKISTVDDFLPLKYFLPRTSRTLNCTQLTGPSSFGTLLFCLSRDSSSYSCLCHIKQSAPRNSLPTSPVPTQSHSTDDFTASRGLRLSDVSDGTKLPAMQETQVWTLIWEDPLEKGLATHSSIRAWKIPCTEEPGRLQSMGSQKSQT